MEGEACRAASTGEAEKKTIGLKGKGFDSYAPLLTAAQQASPSRRGDVAAEEENASRISMRTSTLALNPCPFPLSHILIAVSGGADSMALLYGLHGLARRHHWRLTVAHLDHGIRGKAAGGDADFVRAEAGKLGLPFFSAKARVPALAKRQGISLEMAARKARYQFLARTARAVKADVIATAHTADDQVETVLLKLIRGAGRAGLSGIDAATSLEGMKVVRPLLSVTRAEIESFLKRKKVSWREDASNRDTAFLRNRVRRELLPLLERDYNPGIRDALHRTREVLAAEDDWMDEWAGRILNDCMEDGGLNSRSLRDQPLAARRRVIRLWLARQGAPASCLEYDAVGRVNPLLGRGRGSESVTLAEGWTVQRAYTVLRLAGPPHKIAKGGPKPPAGPVRLKVPGQTLIPSLGLRITVKLAAGLVREPGRGPGILPARASLSAEARGGRPILVRLAAPGDRIAPYGMNGSRKLQDILVDAKVPRASRSRISLLECDGEVVWLPGYRIARAWAIRNPDARNLQVVIAAHP